MTTTTKKTARRSTRPEYMKHEYVVKIGSVRKRVRSRRFLLAFTGERFMDGKPFDGPVVNVETGKPVSKLPAGKPRFIGATPDVALAS